MVNDSYFYNQDNNSHDSPNILIIFIERPLRQKLQTVCAEGYFIFLGPYLILILNPKHATEPF